MPHKDPEAGKAYHKAYREKHREHLLQRMKDNYQLNKEHRRAYMKKWYVDNQPTVNAYRVRHRKTSPWEFALRATIQRAKAKEVPCTLNSEWAKEIWTGICALSGIPFDTEWTGKNGPRRRSPSIDRIIPSLGYVPSNVRFILHSLNSFRGNGTDAEMLEMAEALIAFTKRLQLCP